MALLQQYIIIDLVDLEDMAPSSRDELKSLIEILFLRVNAQTLYDPMLVLELLLFIFFINSPSTFRRSQYMQIIG